MARLSGLITVLLLTALLRCHGTRKGSQKGKGTHGQGKGRAQVEKSKGEKGQVEEKKTYEEMTNSGNNEGTSSNSNEPVLMHVNDLGKCANAFAEELTVSRLNHQLWKAGPEERFAVDEGPCNRIGYCHVTMRNFVFDGYANIGVTRNQNGAYFTAREVDLALCADTQVTLSVKNASNEFIQWIMTLANGDDRILQTVKRNSSVCIRPRDGKDLVIEGRYELLDRQTRRQPLDTVEPILVLDKPTTLQDQGTMTFVGNEIRKRLVLRYWVAVTKGVEEGVSKVRNIVENRRTNEKGMEEVVFGNDMGLSGKLEVNEGTHSFIDEDEH